MRKIKILYVEDNHANIALVRRLLSDAGYDVLVAEDGMEGIRVARRELPHLILMDINLPGMDGYEASTKIKGMEQLKEIPIVAVTANVNPGDRERSLAAGCDGYISKPINVKSFVV
jgi:CheY-like chemotaxis protein